MVGLLPGEQIVQDFVENDAAAPHVTFYSVGLAKENLGRHVNRSSYAGTISWAVLRFLVADHFGKSKVGDFHDIVFTD